jgi:hypothetical protein
VREISSAYLTVMELAPMFLELAAQSIHTMGSVEPMLTEHAWA